MADYKSTTDKHPTDKLMVAKRSGKIRVGKNKVLDVDAGEHARASNKYDGQAGPSVLFAPTGNHSKFVLHPSTISKFYKPADSGEQTNIGLRDERGTKSDFQTGGRRSPEEIAGEKKPKGKKGDDQQDRMRIDKQSENEPMRLAAGDQYDTQDVYSLIEQLCALDDDQLDEFLDTLSDEQVELIEQQLEEIKSQQYYADRERINQMSRGQMADTPAAERAAREAMDREPGEVVKAAAKRLGTSVSGMLASDAARDELRRKEGPTPGRTYAVAHQRKDPTSSFVGPGEEKDAVASGVQRGVAGDEQQEKPKTQSGPGLKSRARSATRTVRLPKKLARKAATISASVEHDTNLDQIQENEEQQMNNYVETAINGDAINFSNTIRDALDAHAHAAIEQIKTSMLESDDAQDQDGAIDEQVETVLEQLEQLDEQQLEQYFGELNEQELLQIEQLLDEAKYGTKKGRHRLAMKIRAGKDVGKKGKHFEEIAQKAGKRYGSAERGRAVAAASMWKRLGGKKGK